MANAVESSGGSARMVSVEYLGRTCYLRVPPVRQIPMIIKCLKSEDLPTWEENLRRMLRQYSLERYIDEDVPEPTDPSAAS